VTNHDPMRPGSAIQVMLASAYLPRNTLNTNVVYTGKCGQSITCLSLPVLEGRAQRRIVIDHEDQGLGVHHVTPSFPLGTVNCTTAPRGTLAVAHSRPPCASIIERLIASPRPRPWGLVV
jgi:hypothetical protein